MPRAKEVLAGGYIRDLLFRKDIDCQAYIHELDRRNVEYRILDSMAREDGSVIIRILQQYNNSLKLFCKMCGDLKEDEAESPLRKWLNGRKKREDEDMDA